MPNRGEVVDRWRRAKNRTGDAKKEAGGKDEKIRKRKISNGEESESQRRRGKREVGKWKEKKKRRLI